MIVNVTDKKTACLLIDGKVPGTIEACLCANAIMASLLPTSSKHAHSSLIVDEYNQIIKRMRSLHTWWRDFADGVIAASGNKKDILLVVHDYSEWFVQFFSRSQERSLQ